MRAINSNIIAHGHLGTTNPFCHTAWCVSICQQILDGMVKQKLTDIFRRFDTRLTSGEAAAADRRLELISDYL